VDTVPLGELLRARGVETVHLLAVDVEGAELAILRSLDFAVVRVEVILVECNTPAVAKEVKQRVAGMPSACRLGPSFPSCL
jgi:hypothetical protein